MNETTKMPRIYTDPTQSVTTVEIISDMDMLEEKLTNMPNVASDEECEIVSEYRAQFRAKAKLLDKERLAMTEGARATVKMVNEKYTAIIERAQRCTQLADNKLLPFMQERERKRRAAEDAARRQREAEEEALRKEAAAKAEAERIANETQDAEALKASEAAVREAREGLNELRRTPVPKVEAKSVDGVLGSSTGLRKVWKYRLTDIAKVPEEYLVPPEERLNKGALNKLAKSEQDMATVPGIEFYYEDTLSSRAGVIK